MKLLLATTSPGKAREQRAALEELPLEIVSLDAWPGIEAPEETAPTFEENAAAKALFYSDATGLAAVAEDAGLEVDALGGEPGVQSARWLGHDTSYEVKNRRLLERLHGVPDAGRTARYVSAVALAENGEILFRARETVEGRIAREARGGGGFGYDPIFFYPPFGRTFGETTPEEKSRVSHRGKAMAALRAFLDQRLRKPR